MLLKKFLEIRIHLEGQLGQFSSLGQQVKQVLLRAGVKMLGDIMILRGQIAGQSLPVKLTDLVIDNFDLASCPGLQLVLKVQIVLGKFSIMAFNDAGQGLT